ncbi:flagellar biosynthetic protein FliR [Puerhibacterium puerhi]|uniref:flagellar biosynthetic protein FliR n=1 Tax=Puerhibacterium puerhi TaxID=2692623 RepID=UPI00135CB8EA|nr:flagellar biosynthetic protein FliR [Puerhibacterium puerhi]
MGPLSLTFAGGALEATLLASVRFAAFLVLAPPFSHRGVPAPVKVALALGLALAVAPNLDAEPASNVAVFLGALALQALVGAALGVLVAVVFAAVQAAGSLIDLFGGFQLATAFDPMSLTSNAPFGRLYQTAAVTLLFVTDAYQVVLAGLVRSFQAVPLGVVPSTASIAETVTGAVVQMFVAALQVAGPLAVVLFLADVGLGLLTRVAPALNAFALGFPLKILLTLVLAGLAFVALPGVIDALADDAGRAVSGVRP